MAGEYRLEWQILKTRVFSTERAKEGLLGLSCWPFFWWLSWLYTTNIVTQKGTFCIVLNYSSKRDWFSFSFSLQKSPGNWVWKVRHQRRQLYEFSARPLCFRIKKWGLQWASAKLEFGCQQTTWTQTISALSPLSSRSRVSSHFVFSRAHLILYSWFRSEYRIQPWQQQSANVSALIRGEVTKGSKCKLKLSVTTIYHGKERTHNTLNLKVRICISLKYFIECIFNRFYRLVMRGLKAVVTQKTLQSRLSWNFRAMRLMV